MPQIKLRERNIIINFYKSGRRQPKDRKVGKEYDQEISQRKNANGPINMYTSKNEGSAN